MKNKSRRTINPRSANAVEISASGSSSPSFDRRWNFFPSRWTGFTRPTVRRGRANFTDRDDAEAARSPWSQYIVASRRGLSSATRNTVNRDIFVTDFTRVYFVAGPDGHNPRNIQLLLLLHVRGVTRTRIFVR